MRHEKTYTLPDKSKLKVIAELIASNYSGDKAKWSFHALTCAKGKRSWMSASNSPCHRDPLYRSMSIEERSAHDFNQIVAVVGIEKIQETADELSELLRFKI